ncbi:MAG: SRPBCC domain-containing protein [Actinomycetota bacterium]|nr:SRPBCC domain-containing protein [Actinomycetota bacterium]
MSDGAVEQGNVEPIRRTISVQSGPERAFELFTDDMGTWWPVELYSRAVSEFKNEDVKVARLEFQARMGGSILEHMSDGRILPWAEVIVWRPPHRVVMAWRPHSAPELPTEIEVTFGPREAGTEVVVEHRGWERLSERFREQLYDIYVRGWPTTLECFAAAASRETG